METNKITSEKMKMNLQLLASDDSQQEQETEQTEQTEQVEQTEQTEKTFTQEDLDRIIAKKFAQWEKKSEQRANEKAKEVEEAEKLKRMSETERQQAEMKKQLEEFNRMKAEMAREKLASQVVKELAVRNLHCEYAEYVMVEGDAEATMERLNTFAEKYQSDIQKEVEKQIQEKLRGKSPQVSTISNNKSSFTVEEIKKMSPSEINKNWDLIKNIKLN